MSFAALAWAGKCKPGSASRKLVLLALADRHNDEVNGAYPSIAWLVEFTDLNRKTVINCLSDLEALKLISDSGERRGDTRQIKLYRLHLDQEQRVPGESHYVYRLTDAVTGEFYVGVRSFLGDPEADSYKGSGKWPTGAAFRGNELQKEVIGTFATRSSAEAAEAELIREAMLHPLCKNIAKEFQKRDRKQTVPKTDNSTKKVAKESQKRDTDSVRTAPSEAKASSGKPRAKSKFTLPADIPAQPWADFEDMRKRIGKPMTDRARELAVNRLREMADDGWPPGNVLNHSTLNSYQGLFPPKDTRHGNNQPAAGKSNPLRGSRPSPALELYRRAAAREAEEADFGQDGAPDSGTWPALPAVGSG